MIPTDASPASPAEAVTTTDPANGASLSLTQSPSTLTITFNSLSISLPIDLLFSLGDIQLEQVNQDGSTSNLFDSNSYPSVSFPTFNQLSIPLSQPLGLGEYRIVLVGNTGSLLSPILSNSLLDPGNALWDPTVDQTLADFTILSPPVASSLSTATPLGTIGTQMQSTAGSLDLSTLENVNLYQITLAPGHFWRLGVQLEAQQIGSPLQGALTLFDSNGKELKTSNSGTGGPDSPADPYLFSGLTPGIYYIGVSGADNLGEQPGGYDPRGSGTFGTSGLQQAGGNYTLDLFADPADTPVRVLGAQLQWGDSLGTSPTGLVLDFSGSLDITSLMNAGNNSSAFWVVDQSGRTWAVTATSYNESQARLNLAFNQPLPPGQYTLYDSPSHGLKDLAGWSPVAPGLPAGVLASWTVSTSTPAVVPGYLGTLWPSLQNGVADSETIVLGQVITSQVFVPVEGLYALQTSVSQGAMTVERAGPDGLVVVDPGSQGTSDSLFHLVPGTYTFTFRTLEIPEVLVSWKLALVSFDHEIPIDNGVGQSVALGLRLVSPTASPISTQSPDNNPSVSPSTTSATLTSTTVPPASMGLPAFSFGVSPLPGSFFVTDNSGLLGGPSTGGEPSGIMGATLSSGMNSAVAGAWGSRAGNAVRWYGTGDGSEFTQSGQDTPFPAVPATTSDLTGRQSESSLSSAGDALALIKSDRIVDLAGRLGRWFGVKVPEEPTTSGIASTVPSLLAWNAGIPATDTEDVSSETGTERMVDADIGMPTGLILVAAATYRLRQLAGRWWRRSRGQVRPPSRAGSRPPWRMPHKFQGNPVGASRFSVSQGR